jgi:hypothetical protein
MWGRPPPEPPVSCATSRTTWSARTPRPIRSSVTTANRASARPTRRQAPPPAPQAVAELVAQRPQLVLVGHLDLPGHDPGALHLRGVRPSSPHHVRRALATRPIQLLLQLTVLRPAAARSVGPCPSGPGALPPPPCRSPPAHDEAVGLPARHRLHPPDARPVPVSPTIRNRPISPVCRTCVPPHSSMLTPGMLIIRTVSPYFSPKSAMAPFWIASS